MGDKESCTTCSNKKIKKIANHERSKPIQQDQFHCETYWTIPPCRLHPTCNSIPNPASPQFPPLELRKTTHCSQEIIYAAFRQRKWDLSLCNSTANTFRPCKALAACLWRMLSCHYTLGEDENNGKIGRERERERERAGEVGEGGGRERDLGKKQPANTRRSLLSTPV